MADREVDPWVFSRKEKLECSDVFIGGPGGVTVPIVLKLQEQKLAMLQEKWPRSIL